MIEMTDVSNTISVDLVETIREGLSPFRFDESSATVWVDFNIDYNQVRYVFEALLLSRQYTVFATARMNRDDVLDLYPEHLKMVLLPTIIQGFRNRPVVEREPNLILGEE